MKKILRTGSILISLAIILTSIGTAFSADATLGLDINSAYVWRGLTFNDGFVAQPSLDVTKGGFNVNVWGNYDIDDYDNTLDDGNFSEIDLTMAYSHSFDKLDLSVGIIEYLFPNGGESTTELYCSASINIIEGLSAGINYYYDVDLLQDFYVSTNIGYSIEINEKAGVGLSVSAGYAGNEQSAGPEEGFNDINVSLSAEYAITDTIGVSANISHTDSLNDDVLPDQDTNTYGGISISCSL